MNDRRGAAFALMAVLSAATMGVGYKLSVAHLNSFVVAVYVGVLATIALLANLIWRGKLTATIGEFRRQPFFFILAGVLGLGIQQIFYMQAYQLMPASNVVFLFYTYPLVMAALSWSIYKEQISLRAAIALIAGFLGIGLLLLSNGLAAFNWGSGVLVTLLAAVLWAFFCVTIKQRDFDAEIGMFLFNLFGTLFLIFWMPMKPANYSINLRELLGLSYLAIIPTAVSLICWNRALQLLKTSLCSNLALLTPMLSVTLIMVILKESLTVTQMLGFGIVVASVCVSLNRPAAVPIEKS